MLCAVFTEELATLKNAAVSDVSVPLPEMNQTHFIAMWKTFYDIFMQLKNEQELYHAVVKVGTLLTSLGDAGKNIIATLKSPTKQNISKTSFENDSRGDDAVDFVTDAPGSLNPRKASLSLPLSKENENCGATGDFFQVGVFVSPSLKSISFPWFTMLYLFCVILFTAKTITWRIQNYL